MLFQKAFADASAFFLCCPQVRHKRQFHAHIILWHVEPAGSPDTAASHKLLYLQCVFIQQHIGACNTGRLPQRQKTHSTAINQFLIRITKGLPVFHLLSCEFLQEVRIFRYFKEKVCQPPVSLPVMLQSSFHKPQSFLDFRNCTNFYQCSLRKRSHLHCHTGRKRLCKISCIHFIHCTKILHILQIYIGHDYLRQSGPCLL